MSSINDTDKFEIPNNEPTLSSQSIKIVKISPSIFLDHVIHHVEAHPYGKELPTEGERTSPEPTSAQSLVSKERRTEPSLRKKSKELK
jgi:hypothetical protein